MHPHPEDSSIVNECGRSVIDDYTEMKDLQSYEMGTFRWKTLDMLDPPSKRKGKTTSLTSPTSPAPADGMSGAAERTNDDAR